MKQDITSTKSILQPILQSVLHLGLKFQESYEMECTHFQVPSIS
jgi:hypothetical protein